MAANSASFADRDEKLFRLNIDLRMEQIRQNSAQYTFDHFQSMLKRNLKEKKMVADTSEDLKADLQKALSYLNEHDVEDEEDFCVLDSIKELASLLRLSLVTKSEGFELTGDCICLQVDTDGKTIDNCFISYLFDSEPKKSEIARRCLQQNQVVEIASSLQKMVQLIPGNVQINGRQVDSSAIGQVLSLLENDIVELKKRAFGSNESPANKYALEFCFARTEAYPFTLVLLAEPFLKNVLQSPAANESLVLYGRVLYSAHLSLEKTDVLNSFPSKSFLGHNKNGWTEDFSSTLPVEYSFPFSRPILLSQINYNMINNLEGITSINVLSRVNLFRHLSGCYQDSIKLKCGVSPELLQQYEMTENSNLNSEDVMVTEIRFIHPKNLTLMLQILRVQLLHNSLFESLCRRPDGGHMAVRGKSSKMCVQCNISSVASTLFNIHFDVGEMTVEVKLSIANGLMKVETTCDEPHSQLLPQFGSLCEDALKSTHSIPLLVHLISTKIQDKFLQLGIPIRQKPQSALKDEDSEEEEENQFDNININTNTSACFLPSCSVGKMGQSWLFVDHKMTTQSNHTNQSHKKRLHTFVVLKEQDSNSLLRSIKHVGLVKELIPAPSTLSHTNNNNSSFGLLRHLSSAACHPPRPTVSSSSDAAAPRRSTETTPATLNYAFSDLEAIAEMDVGNDAESVMSEAHSNMSVMDCSPSASTTAQGDKTGARQLSPIEQAKLSTLYRRRLMQQQQQQQAGQQSNLQNSEVFDFRAENEHGIHMQSPNLIMPGGGASSGSATFDNNPANQYMQFDPLGLPSPVPFTPSSSGRRRGRGRKGGNSGDRMPSMDLSELPESPSSVDYMLGQTGARKPRGAAGTPTQRRARKPRKPSNVGAEQSYMLPYAVGERPLIQRSFSKQSANYVASPNEDMQMKLEMEFCYDYSSEEETDPPPPRNLEPSATTCTTIRQKMVKSCVATKSVAEEQPEPSKSTSEAGGKFCTPQQLSKIASLSSNNSSSSTNASPSSQEDGQKPAANEPNSGAQPSGKAIKMDVETADASPSNKDISLAPTIKAKPSAAARKPSVQPAKLVEPKVNSTVSSAPTASCAGASSSSYLDLYDNELDSSTPCKAEPMPKLVSKEKVKMVVSSKPAKEKSSSSTSKEKDRSKSKSSKGQKSEETLKVVLKLPKASKEGKYDAKYSASSSPSSSSSSSVPAAPVYAAASNPTVSSTEPIARLSSHAAPPSKSKSSIQSRYGVDVGVQQRQQPLKRKSSVERSVEEKKKKIRKEAGLAAPSGSLSTATAAKTTSSKDAPKASKKSSNVPGVAPTTATIGSEYSSLVNTPSKFMSLKNFRIPKVVESETAAKAETSTVTDKDGKNTATQDTPLSVKSQEQSFLQRRPSKSILKNSAPHLPIQQQQQMAPSYRGQAPQNRKALLPSPMDKRPSPRPSAPSSATTSFQGSWPVVGAQKLLTSGYTPAKDWAFQPSSTVSQSSNEQQQQSEQDSLGRDNSPSEELRICDEED